MAMPNDPLELNRASFLSAPSVVLRQSGQSLTSVPCSRLLDFGLVVLIRFLPGADLLRSVRCPAGPALLSLLRALLERPARSLSNEPTACLSVSEKRTSTMAGILVWLFVAMSWSGFVALVHDHRELQGSFSVSLNSEGSTPCSPC